MDPILSNNDSEYKWKEEDLVNIRAIQHYAYCKRQFALIYLENIWLDNVYTLRGKHLHENVDIPRGIVRENLGVEFSLPVWSERLGLIGVADIVEFLPDGTPYPVDYKPGPLPSRYADELQLCSIVLCLEEMFNKSVNKGALYYNKSRRRVEIICIDKHFSEIKKIIKEIRDLFKNLIYRLL
ncbi:CRISPR-associated protein Cas4 [Brockia lithotrophica]|uniref:CRISPR-associated exonuclease Cas4 n=1 Tax=Brockia lithotrophica TaxID=933949 RepID=A0A660L742_9BACL|nr:CRISPR-associated protein Cas4 [Brockia lithotrophica]RKQ89034.1 CRISPR-associated Cas4 family exonuclease [Brockia lithotrophica]